MAPFFDEDEDEDEEVLDEFIGDRAAGAAPELAYQPDEVGQEMRMRSELAGEGEDPIEAFARMNVPEAGAKVGGEDDYEIPDPPMLEKPSTGWHMLAALADLAVNQGRGASRILDPLNNDQARQYENYRRQVQHQKDRRALADSGRGSRDKDWFGREMELQRYRLSRERFEAAQAENERKRAYEEELRKPDSDASKRIVQDAIDAGADPAEVTGKSGESILKWRPQIGQEAQQARAFKNQQAIQDRGFEIWKRQQGITEEKKIAGEEREEERAEAARQITGYVRNPNAARIGAKEAEQARDSARAVRKIETAMDNLIRLDEEIDPLDRALGWAGVSSPTKAEAQQWLDEVASSLRILSNFGTPTGDELARIAGRAPGLATLDGFLNGADKYRALKKVLRTQLDADLHELGYDPPGAGPAPGSTPWRKPKKRAAPAPSSEPAPSGAPASRLEGL